MGNDFSQCGHESDQVSRSESHNFPCIFFSNVLVVNKTNYPVEQFNSKGKNTDIVSIDTSMHLNAEALNSYFCVLTVVSKKFICFQLIPTFPWMNFHEFESLRVERSSTWTSVIICVLEGCFQIISLAPVSLYKIRQTPFSKLVGLL